MRALGATHHSGTIAEIGFAPDIVVECTGAGQVIADAIRHVGAGGVVCLTGIGSGGRTTGLYPAILLARLVFLATGGGLAGPGQGAPPSGPGQG